MTTKHTPPPWEWIGDNLEAGRDDVLRVGDDGKEYGLHSAVLFESEDPEQAAANRALLAAAPDLLEALEYALPYLRACVPNPRSSYDAQGNLDVNCVDRAIAAIAKATGESL